MGVGEDYKRYDDAVRSVSVVDRGEARTEVHPGTTHAINEMDDRLAFLSERIQQLGKKLQPILTDEVEKPSDPGDVMPPISELSNRLYAQIYAIQRLAYTVSELTDRVDL